MAPVGGRVFLQAATEVTIKSLKPLESVPLALVRVLRTLDLGGPRRTQQTQLNPARPSNTQARFLGPPPPPAVRQVMILENE